MPDMMSRDMDDRLWRDRDFVVYWVARTVSIGGGTVTAVVLPILMFQLTGSPAQTALLTAFEVLPYLGFGLIAGSFADRGGRRRIMVGSDLLNALLLATVPIAALAGEVRGGQVLGVALASAALFVWFDAANFGALPALVGRDRIVAATSALGAAEDVLSILGPVLGGLLVATLGAAPALWVDAASYACSGLALLAVRRPMQRGRRSEPVRLRSDVTEGLRYLWRHRLLRTLVTLGFGASFTCGAVLGLVVVYAVRGLHLGTGDPRIGVLYAAIGAGSLLATLLLPRLVRLMPAGRVTVLGLGVSFVGLVAFALTDSFAVALVPIALWNAAYVLVVLNGITLRQQLTPDRLQSRVNTAGRMLAWGGQPFGATVGGLLAQVTGPRVALLAAACGTLISAAAALRSPLWNTNPEAAPEDQVA